uniref:non-specific serine/threonine protein kinase n=1 Tax=Meloidogyne floridensis TaxID=298350 RepID=A0A915P7P3_9BILA
MIIPSTLLNNDTVEQDINSSTSQIFSQNCTNKNFEMLNNNEDEIDEHIPTTPDPNSFKLQPHELNQFPDEIFDIVSKVGEGSYGSVHKALHKSSGRSLAIKMVPVDTDLQEIIKEITIMQQCDSRHVVKYYGSYFKNSDLWIVMEYCGAGSVSDIMRLRRKTLDEFEIKFDTNSTMVSTNSERKNSSTKNSLIINSETLGSGIENNNDGTLLTNFDDGTLIQYGESIRHASLDSNVSNAFKRAMNGQGDYAFVS